MPEYEVIPIKGKNYTGRVLRPILTAEERKRREEEVKKALVEFWINTKGKQYV